MTMKNIVKDVRKYDFIDALRGYAILGVILVHSSQSLSPGNSILQQFMSGGARGVQLFYVTSALTLCMSWHYRCTREASPVRNFFIRRFFRIAPMFYVAIVFYVMLDGFSPRYWAPNGIEWWFLPLTMTFLHGFIPETVTSVVPGGWSVAAEMYFYLMLPFLLRWLKSLKRLLLFFVFSLALSAIAKVAIKYVLTPMYPPETQYLVPIFFFLSFFAQLSVFAVGLITYYALKHMPNTRRTIFFLNPIIPVVLIIISLAAKRNLPGLPGHVSISIFSHG